MTSNALIVDIECVGIDRAQDYLEPVEPDPKLLEPIEPDSRLKDPAKVAANLANVERRRAERPDEIAASIAERTEKLIERCGLDPDLCRIVALGVGFPLGSDRVAICQNEEEEAKALELFWGAVMDHSDVRPILSFNGFGYDLPVLMRRSQYLGITHPVISLDRYRSPHLDLMQRLTWNGAIKAHKLSFYASRFGWSIVDTVDGSQIAALVKAGDWAAVERHCLNDLAQTRFIAQKLKLIPDTVLQPVTTGSPF